VGSSISLIDEVANPGEHNHRQVVFEPELVVGESTVALPSN
jgi:hypothetical protein